MECPEWPRERAPGWLLHRKLQLLSLELLHETILLPARLQVRKLLKVLG